MDSGFLNTRTYRKGTENSRAALRPVCDTHSSPQLSWSKLSLVSLSKWRGLSWCHQQRAAMFQCPPPRKGKPDKNQKSVRVIYLCWKTWTPATVSWPLQGENRTWGNATTSAFHSITSFGGTVEKNLLELLPINYLGFLCRLDEDVPPLFSPCVLFLFLTLFALIYLKVTKVSLGCRRCETSEQMQWGLHASPLGEQGLNALPNPPCS